MYPKGKWARPGSPLGTLVQRECEAMENGKVVWSSLSLAVSVFETGKKRRPSLFIFKIALTVLAGVPRWKVSASAPGGLGLIPSQGAGRGLGSIPVKEHAGGSRWMTLSWWMLLSLLPSYL